MLAKVVTRFYHDGTVEYRTLSINHSVTFSGITARLEEIFQVTYLMENFRLENRSRKKFKNTAFDLEIYQHSHSSNEQLPNLVDFEFLEQFIS